MQKNKKNNPLISVIIPTFNREKFLESTIESVFNQSYKNIELIVVDDGSTDNTEQIINSMDNNSILYIKLNKNMGCSFARNIGFHSSKGEYIAFLDSDDKWVSNKLEEQLEVFKLSKDIGVVTCDLIVKDYRTNKKIISKINANELNHDNRNLLFKFHDNASMLLVKRKYLMKLDGPFDVRLRCAQVRDLLYRLSHKCMINHLNKTLVIYNNHLEIPRNTLYESKIQIACTKTIINKHDIQKYPKLYSIFLFQLATNYLDDKSISHFRIYAIKSIQKNILNTKAWLYLIVTLFGFNFYTNLRNFYHLTKIVLSRSSKTGFPIIF